MLKGFKDFILRGNVIELSIAVVVGTAFTALVSAFTTNIVNPIIAAAGGVETQGLGFHIWPGNDKTFVNIGAVVTAFLTFLITAAVVYFIFVAPMNRINSMVKNRLAAAEPEEEPIPADTALLAEIRDLLARLAGPDPDGGRTGAAGDAGALDGAGSDGAGLDGGGSDGAGLDSAGTWGDAGNQADDDADGSRPRHAASR